jgi:uncharacterized protein YbbK (DUF523 family)
MPRFARPLIVISRCIDFDACRYNGQVVRASLRDLLEPYVRFEPICPELEVGLGVPRDPIRIVAGEGPRLVQPSTGRDLTDLMRRFAVSYLSGLEAVDGFILKARSPSCAVRDARLHVSEDADESTGTRPGMFAEQVIERFPHAAVEDEARLNDLSTRDHFLTKVFVSAAFRETTSGGDPEALARFHERNESLLVAHDPDTARQMRTIVSDRDRYRDLLTVALSRPANAPYSPAYPPELAG